MKISVVIPAYNEEAYIQTCLDGLMRQNVKPDEIILVNNNSTDKTVEIAKNYPIRIINETKQGMTPTRNRGFNKAKYDIIARTDADTIVPVDWIKKIKKRFLDKNLVALSGPAEFYDLPEFVQNARWQTKPTWLKLIKSYNSIVKQVLKHDCLIGSNYSIRRNAWKKVRNTVCLNDKQVHEDLDLAIHLAPLGKIKYDNSLVVSTSVRRWKRPESYFEYLTRVFKSIQKHKQLGEKQKGKQFMKKIILKTLKTLELDS